MNYVTSIFSSVKGYYDGINGATLTGALDVIVVKQPDGTLSSSPFHVRFGKLNVLQSAEKLVDITVNGQPVSLQMKLGANGEAFFVKTVLETDEEYSLIDTELYQSASPIQTDSPMIHSERERRRQASTVTEEETEFSDSSSDQDDGFYGDRYGAEDCLSDSELLATQHRQQNMDINNRIVWDWGDLPHENRLQDQPTESSADEEGPSFMRGMWEYMGRGRRKRKNTFSGTIDVQDGMFLDDIDTDDPRAVSHYFGVRSNRRTKYNEDNDSDEMLKHDEKLRRLDALSLEAPKYYMNSTQFSTSESSGINMQTQTRTMSKRNKRTQTGEDFCTNDSDILLSLCGEDLECFDNYVVTFDQIEDDPARILDDENLIVKCGHDFYPWHHAPNDVLIAMAFRESRSLIEEDAENERDRSFTYGSLTEDLEEEVRGPRYIKTVRLSSEELASLELHDGANVMTFSVTTSYQGTTKCSCSVYLWDYTDKVIISDIDGTITRSDVFGHVFSWVGKDWTQNNIAELFSALHSNGYKFLYLSSRAIGQASMTKNFLKSIKQNGVGIPEGPMLLSPDSLLRAFKVELVLKRPDIFKIKCLSDIKGLFGKDSSPFYAGFGNKTTDSKSYEAVGIPRHRIYRINHRGEIYTENSIVQHCTYAEIYEHNEVYFPIVRPDAESIEEEYLTQNFWRPDFPELDENDLEL
ncbi:hypothetical protein ACHWQZ_G018254 [Mnemiopsis leidyi]